MTAPLHDLEDRLAALPSQADGVDVPTELIALGGRARAARYPPA